MGRKFSLSEGVVADGLIAVSCYFAYFSEFLIVLVAFGFLQELVGLKGDLL